MEGVWSEQDTTPSHIEAGLRELLKERHADNGGYVPARVLNLVVILDREWRGEIENRLERVGRYHPSRTVMIAVEPRRERLDAWAFMVCEGDASPGSLSVCHEHVVVEVGSRHLRHLDTIVDLTQRIDAMVALVIAYDRTIAAIERSLDTLRG